MASSGYENLNRSLREALFETLTAIFSPVHDVRVTAEEQIKALEVTEEFGVHLTELTLDPSGPLEIRQLASVLLKQYVECHWYPHSKKFRFPEVSEGVKAAIRHILPVGLKESSSKVRSSVAYAISAIAHWDWPESWPELFDILIVSLKSGDAFAVHGCMRVLTEMSRDISDIQMPIVAPVIFPELYTIFHESEKYGVHTRRRAVEIFCTCAHMIITMSDYDKSIGKTLLYPFLPLFTEAFVRSLQDKNPATTDNGLKMEALKALTMLVRYCPHKMATWLSEILTPVWNTLTECSAVYQRTIVNHSEPEQEAVDSDGKVLGFENLVLSIFDFVHALIDAPKFRATVQQGINDLVYYVVQYMQITEAQVAIWTENPDRFVEDEDDDTFSYSVRISAQDVLLSLCEEFEDEWASGLVSAVTRHFHEADILRVQGNPHWWKLYETCLLAIGSSIDVLITKVQENQLNFDLMGFLQNVVLNHISSTAYPFLSGRCIWFGSCYPLIMNSETAQSFIQATMTNFQESSSAIVRISAVRAIWGYSNHLKSAGDANILIPYLNSIIDGLVMLATRFQADVLSLVLKTLSMVLSLSESFTSSCESRVTPLAIAIFLKYNSDPVVIYAVQEVLKELVENSMCRAAVQQRLLPTLISILQAPTERIPVGMQSVSMDLLQTVVRANGYKLSPALMEQAFPVVAHCTLITDDSATMQNGGECLRAYVSVDLDSVARWHDEQGRDGLWHIVQVATRLLDPRAAENTAAFVGRLVSVLVLKAGTILGDNLDLLLKAVLSKMQQAESLAVIQSLVMVFAHLVNNQMEAVLEFLSSVPGPTGKSALEFVLVEWCSRQHLFYGSYQRKISALALCKLLQHGINTQDARLNEVQIKGDQIFSPNEGIKTRSQAKHRPDEWTVVPLLVKICKLIINELSNVVEMSMSQDEDIDGDDDDDQEDDSENGNISRGDEYCDEPLVSSLLCPGAFEPDNGEDDPDIQADPLNAINLSQYLGQFLQSFVQQPCFLAFETHLTPEEKQVLATVAMNP